MDRYRILPDTPYRTYQEYLDEAGGAPLARAAEMGAEAIVNTLEESGLRGRGGAGFPTGTKWRTLLEADADVPLVVCNLAEGEPGTFKDRMLMRRNPYAVLEGVVIAARMLGARLAYIAAKETFLPELKRLYAAIGELEASGALEGLELRVVEGPDAYLYGEETAMLEVIEGGAPQPRFEERPPYEWGLRATATRPKPTLMNNAETLARVPGILLHGSTGFRAIGTPDTAGPVLYTFSGDVARPGVYEASPASNLRDLLERHAGGPRGDAPFKLAMAGVSAGVIPAMSFDTTADFGSLQEIGSGLGSAGFVLHDATRPAPAIAAGATRFLAVESCGQCPPCKDNLRLAWEHLTALLEVGETDRPTGLDALRKAAHAAPTDNICSLPEQGEAMLVSFLHHFRDEFEARLKSGAQAMDPIPVLKIRDLGPGGFHRDPAQARKNLDWTYEGTPPRGAATPELQV